MLDNNLATGDEVAACEKALRECLVKAGAAEEEKEPKDATTLRNISAYLYENYGTNGFSEMPVMFIKNLFAKIFSVFAG